jgi:hypothetical protein
MRRGTSRRRVLRTMVHVNEIPLSNLGRHILGCKALAHDGQMNIRIRERKRVQRELEALTRRKLANPEQMNFRGGDERALAIRAMVEMDAGITE